MKDFFISYNKADRAWAEWVAWQLEDAGFTTVLQAWDFRPGSNFVLEMQEATSSTDKTIAILSPDYLSADFTHPEWAAAFARDATGRERTLIPIIVRECNPQGLLRSIIYAKLIGLDEKRSREELLSAVASGRAKPEKAPEFPGRPTQDTGTSLKPAFPGKVPEIWMVPHHRNVNFTARNEILHELHNRLRSGDPSKAVQVISGLGGIGKTQIALEYIYRFSEEYNAVFWLAAEETGTLAAQFSLIANAIGLDEKQGKEREAITREVLRWLERNQNWLLIFDNALSFERIADYIPKDHRGNVIITSANPVWGAHAESHRISRFELAEAVSYLLERTGQNDEIGATALAQELGRLPLALEQASAYMEATSLPISDYLDLFQVRREELWKEETPPANYPNTVATTWSLAIEHIQSESHAATHLLNLCAFLAPDDISIDLLLSAKDFVPDSLSTTLSSPIALNNVIASLRRFSLIEVYDRLFSIHRLVQIVVRDRMDDEVKRIWASAAVCLVQRGFNKGRTDLSYMLQDANVILHALTAVNHCILLGTGQPWIGLVLGAIGNYILALGEHERAIVPLEMAILYQENEYGKDSFEVAGTLNTLSIALMKSGRGQEALQAIERAITIVSNTKSGKKEHISALWYTYGLIHEDLGNPEKAIEQFKQAITISEEAYGSDNGDIAAPLSSLAILERNLGNLHEAKTLLERALDVAETAFGSRDAEVATISAHLGTVLMELGELESSYTLFQRSFDIHTELFGPNNVLLVWDLRNLGDLALTMGNPQSAYDYHKAAVDIAEAVHGVDHRQVAAARNALSGSQRALGQFAEARSNLEYAVSIYENLLGDSHPNTRKVRANLEALEEQLSRDDPSSVIILPRWIDPAS